MKHFLLILILLTLTTNMATAQKYVIKVNGNETQTSIKYEGVSLSNNKITLKTSINGHKVRIKSPSISKSKYLRLVNIAI